MARKKQRKRYGWSGDLLEALQPGETARLAELLHEIGIDDERVTPSTLSAIYSAARRKGATVLVRNDPRGHWISRLE